MPDTIETFVKLHVKYVSFIKIFNDTPIRSTSLCDFADMQLYIGIMSGTSSEILVFFNNSKQH